MPKNWWNKVHLGTCERMDAIPDKSVQCVVTSPPYYNLRDYGIDGQIGLEKTLAEYIERLCVVFDECRRVLRDDGVMFVNLGDSYASTNAGNRNGASGTINPSEKRDGNHKGNNGNEYRPLESGMKAKDLMLVPSRFAIAMVDRGWWLRDDIIWHKPAVMPSSVDDRCTPSYEHVFMFSKRAQYFCDMDAVRQNMAESSIGRINLANSRLLVEAPELYKRGEGSNKGAAHADGLVKGDIARGANLRNVWTIATVGYADAHFATFPIELPTRCIQMGTSEAGCCAECGSPWARITGHDCQQCGELVPTQSNSCDACGFVNTEWKDEREVNPALLATNEGGGKLVARRSDIAPKRRVGPFKATCEHGAATIPCTVLDPFMGSGTTGQAAESLGRRWTGYELNEKYIKLIEDRTRQRGLFSA